MRIINYYKKKSIVKNIVNCNILLNVPNNGFCFLINDGSFYTKFSS